MLVDHMIKTKSAGEWNFGPGISEYYTVSDLSKAIAKEFGIKGEHWILEKGLTIHEAGNLLLDSSKARRVLGWQEVLNFENSIKYTCDWYKQMKTDSIREFTLYQIKNFSF